MNAADKIFHWAPRALCILAILFISMFALDAFNENFPMSEQIASFLVHLIPSFVLLLFLLIAWKWEFLGGMLLAAVGLLTGPFVFLHNYKENHFSVGQCLLIALIINVPFFVVGMLFIFNHFRKKRASK